MITLRPALSQLRALAAAAVVASALASPHGVADAQLPPPSGAKPFATLLCKFPDFPDLEPGSREHFERYLAAPAYPSVAHYWTEVGNGQFSLSGSRAFGWFTLPEPSSYYVSTFSVKYSDLHTDCVAAADSAVHFPDFHGINIVVNGSLNGVLTAGGFSMNRDGVQKQYVATYLDASITNNIGLAAHEIGHTFGLPHTSGPYGATYDSRWDVMSASGWYRVPGAGPEIYLPAHPSAYQKRILGLIPPARQLSAGIGTTEALLEHHVFPADNANPLMIVVPVPGSYSFFNPAPYYILELRGGPNRGYDSAHPDAAVVMHFARSIGGVEVLDVDSNGDPNDDGARWVPGERFEDRVNDITIEFLEFTGSAIRVRITVGDRDMIAVAPAGRTERAFGDTAAWRDSTQITASGPSAATLAWRAVATGRRIMVENPTGTGSAMLRWTSHPGQLGPGIYVDTIVVTADAAANRVVRVVDTLAVFPPTVLSVGVWPASIADSLLTGQARQVPLRVEVRPGGPGADTASWTAASRAAWIELETGTGIGIGQMRWRHTAVSLPPGVYVDTISVALANGASAHVVDTLRVLSRPAIALQRSFGAATLAEGSAPALDSVFVTLTGEWRAGAVLTAYWVTGTDIFLSGDPNPPVGGGWVRIRRAPGSLAPGTYVNRMRVALAMDPSTYAEYEDTLRVTATAPRILLSKTATRDSIFPGASLSMDSVLVMPQGPNASTRKWESRARYENTLLLFRNGTYPHGSGIGHAWLVWMRNTAGDGPGIYVDTIWVKFSSGSGDSTRVIDTLVIRGDGPTPVLTVLSDSLRPAAVMGAPFADTLEASGGNGGFRWELTSGALPAGVTLAEPGTLHGIPTERGDFRFVARVSSGALSVEWPFRIAVSAPALSAAQVLEHLLGGTALDADRARYLDLLGNRNGRVDVGDARAWIVSQQAATGLAVERLRAIIGVQP